MNTRTKAAILAAFVVATLAAQKTVYRDRDGRKTYTSTTDSRGVTVYRDRDGRRVGTSTTDSRGVTVYRDREGRKAGTAQ